MSCASRLARETQGAREAPERPGLRVLARGESAHCLRQPGSAENLDGPAPHRDPRQARKKDMQGPGRTPAMKAEGEAGSPACCALHRIAFPVVLEWCQTILGIWALALSRFRAASPGPRHPEQA